MTVRYYLSPIVEINLNGRVVNASKTMVYRDGSRHSIARFRDTDWCLCRVDAELAEHALITADVDITLIPFISTLGEYLPSTSQVNQISAPNRTLISTFLENKGIPTDWITGSNTIRQVLKFIVVYFNASQIMGSDFLSDFTLTQTVGDIPAARRQRISDWMNSKGIDTSDFTLSMTIRQVLNRICQQLDLGRVTIGPEEL